MRSMLLVGLLVNMLMMSKSDYSKRHVRHSQRDTHEKLGRQQRQWQPTNYRSHELSYQHHYPNPNANRQEALTSEILSLLRELNNNLSTQKQRQYFQPIYVPYPVPLSIPLSSYGKPNVESNKPIPSLPSRIFFVDDENEYTRPIMLKPVTEVPYTTTTTKIHDSGSAIVFKDDSQNDIRKPSRCESAILFCCRLSQPDQVKTCFSENVCSKTYATKLACEKKTIQTVIQRFADTFGPK